MEKICILREVKNRMLSIAKIKERLAKLELNRESDATAHEDEDTLHQDVLRAIASGNIDDIGTAQAFASLVLKSTQIDFCRWYS